MLLIPKAQNCGNTAQVHEVMAWRPHVHQPLIQTIVNELKGHGRCDSTRRGGARTAWVMERCLAGNYGRSSHPPTG